MSDYATRKSLNADTRQCVYAGCEVECGELNLLCDTHAESHRQRNLKWWHIGRKRQRWIQLDLSSLGLTDKHS